MYVWKSTAENEMTLADFGAVQYAAQMDCEWLS